MLFDVEEVTGRIANDQTNTAGRASVAVVAIWKIFLVWCVLFVVLVVFVVLAFKAHEASYWEAFWVECASATAVFMLSPAVLARAEVDVKKNCMQFLGCATILAAIAYFLHGALQLLLINLAVGLVLLLALELFFHKYVLGRIQERFNDDINELNNQAAVSGSSGAAQPPQDMD